MSNGGPGRSPILSYGLCVQPVLSGFLIQAIVDWSQLPLSRIENDATIMDGKIVFDRHKLFG